MKRANYGGAFSFSTRDGRRSDLATLKLRVVGHGSISLVVSLGFDGAPQMSSEKIKLDLGQFALLTHRSREDVRSLAEQKASEGLWRFEAGQNSEPFVELPSADLYHELEVAAGVSDSKVHQSSETTTSACHTPEGSIHRLKHENANLRAVLAQCAELIEELKDKLKNKEASSNNCDSPSEPLITSLSATKAELVQAYDRIIDLQRQLTDTQQANLRLLEENKIVVYLRALLAGLDTRINDTRDIQNE